MESKKRLLYLNLTSVVPHVGSIGVTYAHFKEFIKRKFEINSFNSLELKKYWKKTRLESLKFIETDLISKAIESSDLIVINGEGTIHNNRGLHLLSLAEFAQKMNKPVFLINATIQNITGFDDVFIKMQDIVVREILSYKYLRKKGINARLYIDDIINADFKNKLQRNYENKIILTDWHPFVNKTIFPIVKKLNLDNVVYSPLDYSEAFDNWFYTVENYKTSSLIIAGRYHSVYLAGLAGLPIVALPVNSHKVLGLIKMSKLPIPYCEKPVHLDSMIKYAMNNKNIFKDFQEYLISMKGQDSFYEIDKYFNIGKNHSIENVERESIVLLNSLKEEAFIRHNNLLLKRNMLLTENSLEKNQQLIENYQYKKWLDLNENLYIKTNSFILNLAISYYATNQHYKAVNELKKLAPKTNKHMKKILSKILIEINDKSISDLIDEKLKFDFSAYLYYLHIHDYKNAWNIQKFRPYSQTLIKEKRYYDKNKQQTIVILLEGGVGDQIRHTLFFREIQVLFKNTIYAGDRRILAFLKSNFSEIDFIDQEEISNYDNIYPILDLYEFIKPEILTNKFYLKSNIDLLNYWKKYFKNISINKKVIGICEGTHIKSYDRLSNIFEFELWHKYINEHKDKFIFVNLSFSSTEKKFENILELFVDLKNDFNNLSAIIASLDLVITPPNTILDISGTLDKKTFAIYTGNKFNFRIMDNEKDFFHKNTQWIGSKQPFEKEVTLNKVFKKLNEL